MLVWHGMPSVATLTVISTQCLVCIVRIDVYQSLHTLVGGGDVAIVVRLHTRKWRTVSMNACKRVVGKELNLDHLLIRLLSTFLFFFGGWGRSFSLDRDIEVHQRKTVVESNLTTRIQISIEFHIYAIGFLGKSLFLWGARTCTVDKESQFLDCTQKRVCKYTSVSSHVIISDT